MYRSLLSRMLVTALLVAVIVKPCLGLFVDPVYASDISIVASDDSTMSENRLSNCKNISLSARIEENDTLALRPKAVWAGSSDWADVKAGFFAPLSYLSHRIGADFSSQFTTPNVLRRLAVLSRFLL